MRVFYVLLVVFGYVSARGSGPYLPSGWRPAGPPFYLPTEVKSADPIGELQFPDTEGSGSDALREYGPPKLEEVSLNTNLGLPDIATDQKPELPETETSASITLKEYGSPKVEEVLLNINQDEQIATEQNPELPETEASDSDAVREYGPPKPEEVFLNINQGLPDVATEQAFFVEVKSDEISATVEEAVNVEVNTQQIRLNESEISTATESPVAEIVQTAEELATQLNEIQPTTVAESLDAVEHFEVTTDAIQTKEVKVQEDLVVSTVTVDIVTPTGEKEEIIVPIVETEELIVVTTDKVETIVPNVEKKDIAIPVTEKEEIIEAVTDKDGVVGSITEKEEITVSTAEKEGIVVSNTEKEIIIPTTEKEDVIVPSAEKEEAVVPSAEKEEMVVPLYLQELVQDALPTAAVEESVILLAEKELREDVITSKVSKETAASANQAKEEIIEAVLLTSRTEGQGEKKTEDVNNIVETIVSSENEVKDSEVPVIGQISSIQETSGSLEQAPQGFPDSGPSGFAVYGPPQQDNVAQETSGTVLLNDVRRRRFSPRLRFSTHH